MPQTLQTFEAQSWGGGAGHSGATPHHGSGSTATPQLGGVGGVKKAACAVNEGGSPASQFVSLARTPGLPGKTPCLTLAIFSPLPIPPLAGACAPRLPAPLYWLECLSTNPHPGGEGGRMPMLQLGRLQGGRHVAQVSQQAHPHNCIGRQAPPSGALHCTGWICVSNLPPPSYPPTGAPRRPRCVALCSCWAPSSLRWSWPGPCWTCSGLSWPRGQRCEQSWRRWPRSLPA